MSTERAQSRSKGTQADPSEQAVPALSLSKGSEQPPTAGPRTGYSGAAARWAADASLAYEPLARHLLANYLSVEPRESAANGEMRALDVGTGTGLAADLLRAAGAPVVGVDLEPDMVRHAAQRGPALVADATCLPFADDSFGLTVAAFLINHLPDPVAGLRELRRVTRPGGAVLCSVYSSDRDSAKNAVDLVAESYGFVAPDWYRALHRSAAEVGTTAAVEAACERAGFSVSVVTRSRVDVGLDDPRLVVRYRLGMPQLRRFVDSLPPDDRDALIADAVTAVRRTGEQFVPEVIEVVAHP